MADRSSGAPRGGAARGAAGANGADSATDREAPPRAARDALIFAVSDGRGTTCTQVARAALVQFPDAHCTVVKRPHVVTADQAREVVGEAADVGAVVFYTLVGHEARDALETAAHSSLVPVVDIIGPACGALRDLFQAVPAAIPGLLYEADRERLDLMDAIDYTLSHDDGRRIHELDQAHVVLVGVSRVGKSVTSFYLAYHGIRVANVPLVPGVAPPDELLALPSERVVGLLVSPRRLQVVREARVETLGAKLEDYVETRTIARELRQANALFEQHGWHSIDASYQAIEVIRVCDLKARSLDGLPL